MIPLLGLLVAQDIGDEAFHHRGGEHVAVGLGGVKRRQALQHAQDQFLLEVVAVLLGETGPSDKLRDLRRTMPRVKRSTF